MEKQASTQTSNGWWEVKNVTDSIGTESEAGIPAY
jgi:hypothetical protein